MDFFERLTGGGHNQRLSINPDSEATMSLQLLLEGEFPSQIEQIKAALQAYDPRLASAECEFDRESEAYLGLIAWGDHRIQVVGVDEPFPSEPLEMCVHSSILPPESKQRLLKTSKHILLFYRGYDDQPFEQYLALSLVAGVFADLGVVGIINENAATATMAHFYTSSAMQKYPETPYEQISKDFPLFILAIGQIKFRDENEYVWVRSVGAQEFGLPNLAVQEPDFNQLDRWYEVFHQMHHVMLHQKYSMKAGEQFKITDNDEVWECRALASNEDFLRGPGEVLVIQQSNTLMRQ